MILFYPVDLGVRTGSHTGVRLVSNSVLSGMMTTPGRESDTLPGSRQGICESGGSAGLLAGQNDHGSLGRVSYVRTSLPAGFTPLLGLLDLCWCLSCFIVWHPVPPLFRNQVGQVVGTTLSV